MGGVVRSIKSKIAIFEGKSIRKIWDEKEEKWYFSIVDVIRILSESADPRKYWNKLAERLRKEGNQSVTICHRLKLQASDGKFYLTDVADTETMLRIIQSIPSPNAEPFKLWLARVGYERIEETVDPELGIDRAMKNYLRQGRTPEWVNLRLKTIEVRKDLTNEWEERSVKENEFAILTDDITYAWAGMKTKSYKQYKGLKKENLRDNMTTLELVLNMLAEASTTEISKAKKPATFIENRKVAKQGGTVAKKAREEIESKSGKSVISNNNYLQNKKGSLKKLDER